MKRLIVAAMLLATSTAQAAPWGTCAQITHEADYFIAQWSKVTTRAQACDLAGWTYLGTDAMWRAVCSGRVATPEAKCIMVAKLTAHKNSCFQVELTQTVVEIAQ